MHNNKLCVLLRWMTLAIAIPFFYPNSGECHNVANLA